ncbi:hypothetical protein [Oleiharenicola lentus]|uniref:hypothetical protein n=1 Tax=Oleiharenicola lentus TaxID=2508720 RepID=UPI003F6644E6
MSSESPSPESLDARTKLAVALMNQGHAQQLTGEPAAIQAAIGSYEQAIAILRALPYQQNPQLANSLGAAWMNRGQLLHRLRSDAQIAPAIESFNEALNVLHPLLALPDLPTSSSQLPASPWVRRNFAGTLLNRACLLQDLSEHRAALADARGALQLAGPHERTELIDADLALKLRRVACDAIGQLVPVLPAAEQAELASVASDLVDDGLAVAREWAAKGETALLPIHVRLFRFGAQLYRVNQPHFLAEFLAEEIDSAAPSPEVLAIVNENLDLALQTRSPEQFLTVGDAASERHLQTARDLKALREKIPSLSAPHLSSVS